MQKKVYYYYYSKQNCSELKYKTDLISKQLTKIHLEFKKFLFKYYFIFYFYILTVDLPLHFNC